MQTRFFDRMWAKKLGNLYFHKTVNVWLSDASCADLLSDTIIYTGNHKIHYKTLNKILLQAVNTWRKIPEPMVRAKTLGQNPFLCYQHFFFWQNGSMCHKLDKPQCNKHLKRATYKRKSTAIVWNTKLFKKAEQYYINANHAKINWSWTINK